VWSVARRRLLVLGRGAAAPWPCATSPVLGHGRRRALRAARPSCPALRLAGCNLGSLAVFGVSARAPGQGGEGSQRVPSCVAAEAASRTEPQPCQGGQRIIGGVGSALQEELPASHACSLPYKMSPCSILQERSRCEGAASAFLLPFQLLGVPPAVNLPGPSRSSHGSRPSFQVPRLRLGSQPVVRVFSCRSVEGNKRIRPCCSSSLLSPRALLCQIPLASRRHPCARSAALRLSWLTIVPGCKTSLD